MRRTFSAVLIALAACAPAGEAPEAAAAVEDAPPALTPEQQQLTVRVQEVTARFADVAVAEQEGYLRDPGNLCADASMVGAPPEIGGMGIHYFRPDLLGIDRPEPPVSGTDGAIDVDRPEVLVYEPQADGSLALVAAEYLVFADAWAAAGNTAPPQLAGQTFAYMADDPATAMDEAHAFAPHHELHVWVHRENPSGVFAEFNPNVTCAHHAMAMEGMAH